MISTMPLLPAPGGSDPNRYVQIVSVSVCTHGAAFTAVRPRDNLTVAVTPVAVAGPALRTLMANRISSPTWYDGAFPEKLSETSASVGSTTSVVTAWELFERSGSGSLALTVKVSSSVPAV